MTVGDKVAANELFTVEPAGKKVTVKSDKTDIVKVDENGNLVAVAPGEATITASSKYTKKANEPVSVKVTVTAAAAQITDLQATSASTLTATLSQAASADAKVVVTKTGLSTPVSGEVKMNGTTVTFSTTANLTAGTYTMTLTDGTVESSMSVEVVNEYVKEIVITSTQALTKEGDKKTAFIYYDVLNQYGESVRTSTTVSWSSSAKTITGDKATGLLTVTSDNEFVYGNQIYVTGVYTKTGVSVNKAVPVGMTQALNSVKATGFVNKNKPTEKLDTLPTDFAKNTYYMIYETRDQDNNLLDATADNIASGKVTFISDNILLVKVGTDEKIFTIDGVSYSAVAVEPGQYVDKGGEINITAISNKTGNKSNTNFVVGENVLLQSLSITGPADVVADGDTNVELSYVAKDTKGNAITNYEAIVRSTNTLNLNKSEGELVIKEKNDGTAGIYWSDDAQNWASSTTRDGVERTISLTTVVVGGTSDNYLLSVSDKRRPVAIKSVAANKTAVVAGDTLNIDFSNNDQVTYLDQYGKDMKANDAKTFFDATAGKLAIEQDQAAVYGVYADFADKAIADVSLSSADGYVLSFATNEINSVKIDNVKLSIASKPATEWNTVGKVKAIDITTVPVDKLSNIRFADVAKQQLVTPASSYDNGYDAKDNSVIDNFKRDVTSATFKKKTELKIVGDYKSWNLNVPAMYCANPVSDDVVFTGTWKLDVISAGALKWSDLYDTSTAGFVRKDANVTVSATVYPTSDKTGSALSTVTKKIAVSDEVSKITSVSIDKDSVNADNTVAVLSTAFAGKITVKDQYDNKLVAGTDYTIAYNVSDVKESTAVLTHLADSFKVNANNSATTSLSSAEIGDAFKLTVTVTGNGTTVKGSATAEKAVTVGADSFAKISTTVANSTDATLRATLGYDR